MTREQAIERMKGAACSKTIPSELAQELTQSMALKMVRHYIKCLPKGAVLGGMVEDRVRAVCKHRRAHS
jgi:hypothetical protein